MVTVQKIVNKDYEVTCIVIPVYRLVGKIWC